MTGTGPANQEFLVKPADFFRRDAETPLHRRFLAAGVVCDIQTNCEPILEAAHQAFLPLHSDARDTDFWLRLWVDSESSSRPPWPKPFVRGLDYLVFASFDSDSSLLVDLHKRRVAGRFSANMGSDRDYWQAVIFPMLMSLVAASVGVVELHCACVVKNNKGYLLAGPSRSGKSTLVTALARDGFAFLSDDRTFCSASKEGLSAWGVVPSVKLRQEAQLWFHELAQRKPTDCVNGEWILRFEPESQLGLIRAKFCQPECLIFLNQRNLDRRNLDRRNLDRREGPEFCLQAISPPDAAQRLDQELMAEPPRLMENQRKVIDRLVAMPCWQLQYWGDPGVIAPRLARHLEEVSQGAANCR
jgi:hypothetical protein